mgnify:FL=1
MNIFIKRLKEIRKDKGLSMSELANKIGVSTNTISRWERGERIPNLEALVTLAKFFKVSTDYLCGLED